MCSGTSSVGRATRPSGNSGKSRTSGTTAESTSTRPRRWMHDSDRVDAPGPARPRPPGADRRGARGRARRARLRARRPAAERPLPVRAAALVPARVAARAARGAARPRRRPRGPPRAAGARAAGAGARDPCVQRALRLRRVAVRDGPRPPRGGRAARGGRRAAAAPRQLRRRRRRAPKPYTVFTPFWRAWRELPRREVHGAPRRRPAPLEAPHRRDPARRAARSRTRSARPARRPARARMHALRPRRAGPLRGPARPARRRHLRALAVPALRLRQRRASSRAESALRREAFVRQLALARLLRPRAPPQPRATRTAAHQERMDALEWEDDDEALAAWQEGRTGYPVVDAGDAPAARPRAGCTTAAA